MATLRGEHKVLPVDKIHPNAWNPNKLDEFMMDKLRHTIETRGFIQEIVVRQVGGGWEIIDGQHRHEIAVSLGMQEIPAVDIGVVADVEAKQLTEIFIHAHGEPDLLAEAKLVRSLLDDDGLSLDSLAEALPFTTGQIEALYDATEYLKTDGLDEAPTLFIDPDPDPEPNRPPKPPVIPKEAEERPSASTPGDKKLVVEGINDEQYDVIARALMLAPGDGAEALSEVCSFYLLNYEVDKQ